MLIVMNFRFYLKEYFHYSKSERAGIRVLCILIFLSCIIPFIYQPVRGSETSFITLKDSLNSKQSYRKVSKNYKKAEWITVDINIADTSELKVLSGIGSYYAKKIVKFRERAGGFHSVEQLNDINLHDGVYDRIKAHCVVKNPSVRKFDFDTISFKNLVHNPYFSFEQVKKVFKLKNDYRGITPEFLLEKGAIDTMLYFKIKPYCVEKR